MSLKFSFHFKEAKAVERQVMQYECSLCTKGIMESQPPASEPCPSLNKRLTSEYKITSYVELFRGAQVIF